MGTANRGPQGQYRCASSPSLVTGIPTVLPEVCNLATLARDHLALPMPSAPRSALGGLSIGGMGR